MAETPANPPRQWTPAQVEGRGAHAPQHHRAEWAPQIWPGPLTPATVPLPTGGPGWLQQEAQCFSPGAETAAATGQASREAACSL